MKATWRLHLVLPIVEALLLSSLYPGAFSSYLACTVLAHLASVTAWSVVLYPLYFSPFRKLPEPEGAAWLSGHKHLIKDRRSGVLQDRWVNEIPNDGLIRYRMSFNKEFLLVTNPKGLSEVLVQRNYDFAKPASLRIGLARILGIGLIVAEGDEHKRQRRLLMPAFAHRHIKNLYPVFWSKSADLARALSSIIAQNATPRSTSTVLNLPGWLARTTLDIIGVAGMGHDFGAIRAPDNEVSNAYASVFDTPKPQSKLVLLKLLLEEVLARRFPIKRSDSVAIASDALKTVGRRLIQQKKTTKAQQAGSDQKDILSVALQSGAFPDEMLVNQILTFLAAGHETTATSMTWAIISLCQHPHVQSRLRDEVREKLPSPLHAGSSTPSAELLDGLPYLHAVCNETMRLHPPVGLTIRVAAKDTTVIGQFVPAGTTVVIPMRAINHSKDLWGSDATDFNPERWLGQGKWNSGGASNNFAFMTFLQGPRSCIGQGFARAEFASLLAVIVGCFETELANETTPIETETGLTTKPKGGLMVRMKQVPGW